MRFLGIDYGEKRVGVAVSDEKAEFAMPVIVFNNTKNLLQEIVTLAEKNKVKEIVIGESKDYKGNANTILKASLEFKRLLEDRGFTIHLEPEFMTSVHAEKFQGKHDMIDASAAALILQSFLDKNKAKG